MHIPFSEKTNELIFELKDFSEDGLTNVNDLATLIEITKGKGDNKSFDKLIFNGKYTHGMKKVLDRDVSITDEAKQNIYEQFQSAVETLIRTIKDITENQDLELQSYFETKYLMLTQENLVSLLSLAGDLAVCKEYYNSLK
jgi:DNA-directed RNA polymerase subunit F